MFVIQYQTTRGEWINILACGKFANRTEAQRFMRVNCGSVIHKRVWPYRPHYRANREIVR